MRFASIRPADPKPLDLLTFLYHDLQGIQLLHDDPLVITDTIANFSIKRILIDTNNSLDILFVEAFDQLEISRDRLRPVATPLIGFNGSTIKRLGMMELPVLMGTYPQQASTLVNFVVAKASSAYNVILGRPILNWTKVVVSTYSLVEIGRAHV